MRIGRKKCVIKDIFRDGASNAATVTGGLHGNRCHHPQSVKLSWQITFFVHEFLGFVLVEDVRRVGEQRARSKETIIYPAPTIQTATAA